MKLLKNVARISSAAVRLAAGVGGAVLVFLAIRNAMTQDRSDAAHSRR